MDASHPACTLVLSGASLHAVAAMIPAPTKVGAAMPLVELDIVVFNKEKTSLASHEESFVVIHYVGHAIVPYGARGSMVSLPVPMLTGDNYTVWVIKVEAN
ncbi:ketol-acid reductoisomerase, chloroplastic [Hordeum vulgare]|nr:ketol-acid reductoisomerase, chloroplastic [Hordeum vulgare]